MLDCSIPLHKTTCVNKPFACGHKASERGRLPRISVCIVPLFGSGGDSINRRARRRFSSNGEAPSLGNSRTLSPAEEATVQQLMREHCPNELNIDSALWTRSAVLTLIAYECGVEMPIRTVGEYLKRWGYTPRSTTQASLRTRPTSSESMAGNPVPSYPRNKHSRRTQRLRGEMNQDCALMLKSVAAMRLEVRHQKFSFKCQRVSVNYIASISNSGKIRFMLYTQKLTTQIFITFMERLIAKRRRSFVMDCGSSSGSSLSISATVAA